MQLLCCVAHSASHIISAAFDAALQTFRHSTLMLQPTQYQPVQTRPPTFVLSSVVMALGMAQQAAWHM
jgi:hypothetical protein